MKNSQRILDSIGKLSDGMIENALSYENPENKRKKIDISPARPMKKLAVSLVAAVLCIALTVTCFANADLIKSIFQREKELIDPYAIKVDESVTVGDITLTVDKVVLGGDYYVYYTFKNNNGIFDKGLTFDRIAQIADSGERLTVSIEDGPEERGTDPNSSIAIAGYGLENPSDTISAMFRVGFGGGKRTFVFENVTSYDGTVKYADEIQFEVNLPSHSEIYGEQNGTTEPVGIIDYAWKGVGSTFTLEGEEMVLDSISFTPYEINMTIMNPAENTVNYFGHDFYYLSYISGFRPDDTKEEIETAFWRNHYWEFKEIKPEEVEDGIYRYDNGSTVIDFYIPDIEGGTAGILVPPEGSDYDPMRSLEIHNELMPHEAELEALTYKAYARLADGCTAEVIFRSQDQSQSSNMDDEGNIINLHNKVLVILKFSTPVYEEEVLEIYLLRESDGARVTIYGKPE